ncbi:MAG: polyprenyl synthetase family protein [Gammaproteobacteria bacterium]|uniref:Polyprenyl synthetase family protein n=1 Tax=Candidatus Thiopontia autotrophica TaxID=2841688 RepID=A0A8J6P919_9GAMM|nr:polyprenyl synthetase family protein [Candidatus Thiopontia autotrophica]MBL6968630.1 polyprenyl synthetase family protein [Gammaproteobacteria bacterium]
MSNPFGVWQQRVEGALEQSIPATTTLPTQLHKAIHYTVFSGGKRIRPILVYAAGKLFDISTEKLDKAAVAVELIHTYSLVHDDLPAMDDDDLRRGEPTCHRAFDEATAILVGDALQTMAFQALADSPLSSDIRLKWIQLLTAASGSEGMVGGQMIDLETVTESDELSTMHLMKTGALIRASILMGATPGRPDETTTDNLITYANSIGLAFQVRDDILDIEGTSDIIGKPQGSDLEQEKSTFVSIFGMDSAKIRLQKLHQQAIDALSLFDSRADSLREIANFIIQRDH